MKKIIYAVLAFAPILALAQGAGGGTLTTFESLSKSIGRIVNTLIPVAFGLAILFFFYGVAKYVFAAGDATKAKEGRTIMIYGVVAIAVMASLFGLVAWLQSAFGVQPGSGNFQPPTINNLGQ